MIFKPKKSQRTRTHLGCGFAGFVMLVVILLMMINGMATRSFFRTTMASVDPRIVDPMQFISTVLLVFFEYWIFDRLTRSWLQRKNDRG